MICDAVPRCYLSESVRWCDNRWQYDTLQILRHTVGEVWGVDEECRIISGDHFFYFLQWLQLPKPA